MQEEERKKNVGMAKKTFEGQSNRTMVRAQPLHEAVLGSISGTPDVFQAPLGVSPAVQRNNPRDHWVWPPKGFLDLLKAKKASFIKENQLVLSSFYSNLELVFEVYAL